MQEKKTDVCWFLISHRITAPAIGTAKSYPISQQQNKETSQILKKKLSTEYREAEAAEAEAATEDYETLC